MIQPCLSRAAARVATILSAVSPSGPASSTCSAIPRKPPHQMWSPAGSRWRKLHSPSSMTTTVSAPSGQPWSRRRRPVVTVTAPLIVLNGIAWAAVGEGLKRSDSRHDAKARARVEAFRDAQGGVVEPGVAPDEEGDGAVRSLPRDGVGPERRDGVVPAGDSLGVGQALVAHGHVELGDAGGAAGFPQDRVAEVGEVRLVLALARDEDERRLTQRGARLERHVRRVAGADPDEPEVKHGRNGRTGAGPPGKVRPRRGAAPRRATCPQAGASWRPRERQGPRWARSAPRACRPRRS